jgi:hypothetical protein
MVPAPALIAALWLTLLAAPGSAHPVHASYAELGWSPRQDALQVALRLIPEDLEAALARRAGRPVPLDPAAPPRRLLEAYLDRHFRVVDSNGKRSAAALLGLEVAHDDTWLYFTLPAHPEQGPFTLHNTVLTESGEGQTNRVRCLWAPAAPLLVFSATEPSRVLPVHD